MKYSRFSFLSLLFCVFSFMASGQSSMQEADTTRFQEKWNRTDAKGQKQGMWYEEFQPKFGNSGYLQYGKYYNDQKEGTWVKMDLLGHLISMNDYTNNVLNGVSRYYKNGNLVMMGTFRGLNPKYELDSILVNNPLTGQDTMVVVPSEQGSVRHGIWRYYSPISGQLIKEEIYQVGDLLYRREFHPEPTAADSLFYLQQPKHLPIDINKATRKIPKHAKQKITY